jgi:lysophospholipase L1-like esterase
MVTCSLREFRQPLLEPLIGHAGQAESFERSAGARDQMDLGRLEAEEPGQETYVAEGVIACVAVIRQKHPAARILAMGIFPCAAPAADKNPMIAQINAAIAQGATNLPCDFLDVAHLFNNDHGVVAQHWMPDGVHLSAGAYDRLSQSLIEWIGANLP